MHRRALSALVLLAAAVVGARFVGLRGGTVDPASGPAGRDAAVRAPGALDAPELAASGVAPPRTGRFENTEASEPGGSLPVMADEADEFPRPGTGTVELRLEGPPGKSFGGPDLAVTISIRSSGGSFSTEFQRSLVDADYDHLVYEVPEVPVGVHRITANVGIDAYWIPEWVSVTRARTTCRLKLEKSKWARFSIVARIEGPGASAYVDVYDRELRVERVNVEEGGATSPQEVRYFADRPVTFVCSGFPGWKSVGPLAPITLTGRSGESERVVFDIPTTTKVSVHLRGSDGSPIHAAHVFLWRRVGAAPPMPAGELTYADAGGPIFRLLPGSYEGRVCAALGHSPRSFRFEVLPAPTQDVEVILDPGDPTELQVRGADGTPVPGTSVWIGAIDGPDPSGLATGQASTDPHGIARFPPLDPGSYRVAIDQMMSAPIEIRANAGALVLEKPIKRQGDASLEVHLLGPSGRTMNGAFVWVDREGDGFGPYTSVEDGLGSLSGLEPGPWRVHVMSSWYFSERVAPFDGRVILKPGEMRVIEIRLQKR